MRDFVKIVLELAKVRIAVLSTLTVGAGYILAVGGISPGIVAVMGGVFLLACGAGAMNQYQERKLDALMMRTRNRPLPSGRVSPPSAFAVSILMMVGGVICLFPNWKAIVVGLITILWYNVVYTYFKRVSAFAAIPGGVVGALPPLIGWVYGGGAITDPRILAVSCFFFVWQIPHFWLLLMRNGEDYERAGLPTLTSVFSRRQLARVTYVWMLATIVVSLLLPVFGVTPVDWIYIGFVAASVYLAWHATTMYRSSGARLAFKQINIYALMIISLISLSGFLG